MIQHKRPLITVETKLKDIPEAWLLYIEHHVKREGTCWLWTGANDSDGEPILNFNNAITHKRNTRRVKRMVAEMFWTLTRSHDVVHECGVLSCIAPSHLRPEVTHWTQR